MSARADDSRENPPCGEPAAEALRALLDRRYSCRGFLARPVPRDTIRQITELAQRTASWCNSQPWQVSIVSGDALRRLGAALGEHARRGEAACPDFPFPAEYRGVYQERRRACGLALYDSVGIARGDRAASARQGLENFRFFGAPHVAIVTTERALGIYGAIDCGAYVSSFMLAATSLGVASIAQAALASYPVLVREQLGISEGRALVCGISFGIEDPAHPANRFRTGRARIDDVLTWVE